MGLYFPYVHFRDDAWLKTTALYWPQIARVVSPEYPIHDNATVQALADSLDFLIPLDPREAAQAISAPFITVIHDHLENLQHNFGVTPEEIDDEARNNPDWRLVNRYVIPQTPGGTGQKERALSKSIGRRSPPTCAKRCSTLDSA
ncbi:hypothetical protein ACFVXW_41800 [Streptomyces sp. NPDC058251]|uniref:hypothetical protein n=1 Tax=unclassified Streptomyces TaxID=2593676 RepID=UPI003653F4A3